MSKTREWIRAAACVAMILLMIGTVVSFFVYPYFSDQSMRDKLGVGAIVTDSARDPWITVDEQGVAYINSANCRYVDELVIPESVNEIPVVTFASFEKPTSPPPVWIERITFPTTLREIGEFPFHQWDALREITFKEGIEDLSRLYIGPHERLEKLVLPASVKSLRPGVLEGAPETLVIHFGGTEEQWRAIGDTACALSERFTVVYESDGMPDEPSDGAEHEKNDQ